MRSGSISSLEEIRDRMRQDMQGVREAMTEARAERRDAAPEGFDETLTPEQLERLGGGAR